jgi:hypothetical protein
MSNALKEVTIKPKTEFECGLNCRFLRRYCCVRKILLEAIWCCELYNEKLIFIAEDNFIHRSSHCNNTYLFTMKIPDNTKDLVEMFTEEP